MGPHRKVVKFNHIFTLLHSSIIHFLFLYSMEGPKKELLVKMVRMKMPFGKYEGRLLCDLPVSYLEWFARKGFPTGSLGEILQTVLVIKSNGLEDMISELKRRYS